MRSRESLSQQKAHNLCHGYRSKRWIVDRAALKQARVDDLQYVDDPELLDFLAIYFANGTSTTSDFHGNKKC